MAEAASAAPESREIRVFLSSTFRDFMEERELLAKQVFPELNRRARERGVELVEVDLRWGVTQEQAEDGHALEICLKEIERCRPYFIGMLGDSYGSLTPPQRQLVKASPELLEQRQWLDGRIGEASYTELEIEHSLQVLSDPAMEGRAFFYFRDRAWSDSRADAGEAGWRSDDPADRQKLELLKDRIRSSPYPLVEKLQTPQAIAERIKDDLWALIDRLFPEKDQPDALEREARKHADYRKARTGAGQYIGGEAYIEQLERWIEQGEQQILVSGESGSGKSALIANWMEWHAHEHPGDVVYAHHLGCTNDANALRPMLGRLIDTASQLLLKEEVINEAFPVPENWWELVAEVSDTLQALSHYCYQRQGRFILVLDGLDRLDADDQVTLPWLPQQLPAGVHVVASALSCPAREILIKRGYATLIIQSLRRDEQELLIQRYLKRYTKELEDGLRHEILCHQLAGSPLFLKVLLEEIRQCGRHEILNQQLEFYLSSKTIDDLYERVLERLENDGSRDVVRRAMTSLWASRAGIAETEMLAINGIKPLEWAPIYLALEKAFGRNGNRIIFDHDYLRKAVEDRYLHGNKAKQWCHSMLADWFSHGLQEGAAEEWHWQLWRAGRLGDLRDSLLNVSSLATLSCRGNYRDVIDCWHVVKRAQDGDLDEFIAEAVAMEIEERKGDVDSQIWFVNEIADLLDEAGLHRELFLSLRAISLELEEATDARGEVSMLNSLAQLADAQRLKGDYENSKRSFIRCLEAQENLLGPDHPSTLVTANNLALMFHDKGDYERAEAFYKRCLEGQERRSRSENPAALITVDNLGTLYWDRGDLEQAELCLKRCLEARERLIGPEHPDTNSTLFSLANLLTDQRRFVEAIPLRRRELNWRRQRNGEMDVHTLWSINRLAIDLREAGELQEAEGLFRDLLVARQALLEPEDFEIGRALGGLAKTLIAESKLEEALDYSRQALNHRLFYEGPDTWWTNLERLDLAKILHKLDRSSEALQQLDALQTSIESLESPDDDDRQLLDDALSLRKAIETGP